MGHRHQPVGRYHLGLLARRIQFRCAETYLRESSRAPPRCLTRDRHFSTAVPNCSLGTEGETISGKGEKSRDTGTIMEDLGAVALPRREDAASRKRQSATFALWSGRGKGGGGGPLVASWTGSKSRGDPAPSSFLRDPASFREPSTNSRKPRPKRFRSRSLSNTNGVAFRDATLRRRTKKLCVTSPNTSD